MRKVTLLLVVVGVLAICAVFFNRAAIADDVAARRVCGLATTNNSGINPLPYYPIQASSNGGSTWSDVAPSNGNGWYQWTPSSPWPDPGDFNMRIKPTCDAEEPPRRAVGNTPIWSFNSESIKDSIRVDVWGANCP